MLDILSEHGFNELEKVAMIKKWQAVSDNEGIFIATEWEYIWFGGDEDDKARTDEYAKRADKITGRNKNE